MATGSGQILKDGTTRPLEVKVGDVVYFRGTSGQEIPYEGETYVMLREDEVEAVQEM